MRIEQDGGRHLTAQDEGDGTGALVGIAVGAALGALAWAAIVQVGAWLSQASGETVARVGALVALLAGSGLVFVALSEIEELGRRPTRAVPRDEAPAVPPSRRDALTAPRVAGPRALRRVQP